ncbi:MAG: hypothetical protein AAF628_07240 [Planctomycetota bacterium]
MRRHHIDPTRVPTPEPRRPRRSRTSDYADAELMGELGLWLLLLAILGLAAFRLMTGRLWPG